MSKITYIIKLTMLIIFFNSSSCHVIFQNHFTNSCKCTSIRLDFSLVCLPKMNWLRINRFLSCRFHLGLVPEINCKCITLTLNKTRNRSTHRKYVSKVKSIWINSKTNIHYILSPGTPHIQVSQKFLVNWVYTLRHSGHQHPPMWASACTSLASLCLYDKFIVFKSGCMYELYDQYFSWFLTTPNHFFVK